MSATTQPIMQQGFEMPQVRRGQPVVFYLRGIVSPSSRVLGFCSDVGRNNIEINVSGRLWDGVHHKDDPALDNPHCRGRGCWELCERDHDIDSRIAAIDARLKTLEKALQ